MRRIVSPTPRARTRRVAHPSCAAAQTGADCVGAAEEAGALCFDERERWSWFILSDRRLRRRGRRRAKRQRHPSARGPRAVCRVAVRRCAPVAARRQRAAVRDLRPVRGTGRSPVVRTGRPSTRWTRDAGVDVVVAHLVADALGRPAERQLGQVAGGEHPWPAPRCRLGPPLPLVRRRGFGADDLARSARRLHGGHMAGASRRPVRRPMMPDAPSISPKRDMECASRLRQDLSRCVRPAVCWSHDRS